MAERPFDPLLLGSDLRLVYRQSGGFFEDADLVARQPSAGDSGRASNGGDLATVGGLENFTQAIANRLKTRQGELSALGHPRYGSRHHELVGEPNNQRSRNLIKLYVLQALRREPRVAKVLSIEVLAEQQPPRDTVRLEIAVLALRSATPVNLVVPFSFGEVA